jgi:hypothetical protein
MITTTGGMLTFARCPICPGVAASSACCSSTAIRSKRWVYEYPEEVLVIMKDGKIYKNVFVR